MKTLTDHLSQYADYHRDPRNIATHFVGIPMIVVAVATLLSRPAIEVAGLTLTPALLLAAGTVLFYLRLDRMFAALMAVVMGLSVWAGHTLAAGSTLVWLSEGIGLFVIGWIFQFVGHFYEGKKPAFVDDLIGLAVGPLFVVAEVVFALGFRQEVHQAIIERSGPVKERERTA